MSISAEERKKMQRVYSIGPRMVDYLELIGIERLCDLRNADARALALRINATLQRDHINAMGVRALEGLIEYANSISMQPEDL